MSGVNFTPDAARKVIRGAQEGIKGDIRGNAGRPSLKNTPPALLITSEEPQVDQAGAAWINFEKGVLYYNFFQTEDGHQIVYRDYIGVHRGNPYPAVSILHTGSLYFVEVEEKT